MLIENGTVFINGKFIKTSISLDGGTISGIGSGAKGTETIDATGMIVLPGLIDPHVHLREPGATIKEDFITGSRAAIAGGFTTIMDMPNNIQPTTTKERRDEKVRLAKEKAVCDILFHFGGTDDNFAEVKKADPQSMKLYLGETTGMMVLKKQDSLENHFKNFNRKKPIVLHAAGSSSEEDTNLKETYAIEENAVALAKKYKRKIHIAHVSAKEELNLVKQYSGCTAEIAPHYLFLSKNNLEKLGHLGKVYPPLRNETRRRELWSVLEKADCIATDHAPHTLEDKANGAGGFPGLETSLALMWQASENGLVKKEWLINAMSKNPAKIFNLSKKGQIRKGFIGDITIFDPKKVWKVDGQKLETKCKWSPFEGMELNGKVHTVIKNGKVVYQDSYFV